MKRAYKAGLVVFFIICIVSIDRSAIAAPSDDAKMFVKEFYDWYGPVASRPHKKPSWILAIEQKPKLFDSKLRDMLRDDYAAQLKTSGEIVGIDFDPFLASQDPSSRIAVGSVTMDGENFLVEVKTGARGLKAGGADVVAEVRASNGHYTFSNFHYPKSEDLQSILSTLKRQRD